MSSAGSRLELPDRGVLFVVSGPSGVGKSTLVKDALARIPGLEFSVSATTRGPRPGEVAGRDYHFVDADQFGRWVDEDAFLEHATVYDRRYGTLRAPVDAVLARGGSVLLDIDVQGAAQVRERLRGDPSSLVSVFVLPPSLGALEQRLRQRASDDEATVARRMLQAEHQLRGASDYDYLVVNDDLERARTVFSGILLAETHRRLRRDRALQRILGELR